MKRSLVMCWFLLAFCAMPRSIFAQTSEPIVYAEVRGAVPAPVSEVWRAFTTAEGLARFFAPAAYIDPEVGGLFELYLFPDNPAGRRGLEGQRIMAFEPERRLMIGWSPPNHVRTVLGNQNVIAEVTLTATSPGETHVRLRTFGFGESPAWMDAKRYFTMRWRRVMENLKTSFEKGSVDWAEAMKRFYEDSEQFEESLKRGDN